MVVNIEYVTLIIIHVIGLQVFPLRQCKVSECTSSEVVEVHYRGMRIECPGEVEAESLTLIASTINEKAQWMTDYSQVRGCVWSVRVCALYV